MRRAAKVDANQAEIVAALRAVGATVTPLHAVGQGCPDILAGYGGLNFLLEVKDGAKPPSARKLTPDQVSWHDTWRGQVAVASSVKEALKIIGALRGEVS
jgi:Holliday junction resolvase